MNRPARRRSSYKKILEDQQLPQPTTSSASATITTIMDGANRKIELQSPEDLIYLVNNVRRAAAEHINAAFPPVDDADDGQEDELRVRIEQIVDEVRDLFQLSYPWMDALQFPHLIVTTNWTRRTTQETKNREG